MRVRVRTLRQQANRLRLTLPDLDARKDYEIGIAGLAVLNQEFLPLTIEIRSPNVTHFELNNEGQVEEVMTSLGFFNLPKSLVPQVVFSQPQIDFFLVSNVKDISLELYKVHTQNKLGNPEVLVIIHLREK